MNEKIFQEKYYEIQVLQKQITEVRNQITQLEDQLGEIGFTIQSLEEISVCKKEKSLIPIANGIFFEGKIEDTQNLLINVGSGVIVKKSIEDTIGMLSKQAQEIGEMHKRLSETLNDLFVHSQNKEAEVTNLIKSYEKNV